MKHINRAFLYCIGLFSIVAAFCIGCSRESKTAGDRYVPATELARHALEAVLVDWREGLEPGPIDRLAVGVRVVDKQRRKGQTLDEFEILGEAPTEAARCFAVRVKLSGPEADEKVRFIIIGIDPLWVFRQEDYESLAQWSCGKQEEEPLKTPAEGEQSVDDDQANHESIATAGDVNSTTPVATEEARVETDQPGSRQGE